MEKFVITSRNSPQLSKFGRISESTLNFRGFHHFPDAKLRFFSKIALFPKAPRTFAASLLRSRMQPFPAFLCCRSDPLSRQSSCCRPSLPPGFLVFIYLSIYLSTTAVAGWRLYSRALGEALGDSTRVRSEVYLEVQLGLAWRYTWRLNSASLGDALGDNT